MEPLEFEKASSAHRQTWEGVKTFGIITTVAVIAVLLIMFAALV